MEQNRKKICRLDKSIKVSKTEILFETNDLDILMDSLKK